MNKIYEAECRNGKLILNAELNKSMDGKKVKIIILEENSVESKKKNFFKFVKNNSFRLPDDYKFIRDELYDR